MNAVAPAPVTNDLALRDLWLAREAVIERIVPEIEGVSTYHLRFTDPEFAASYRFTPGQFNMLYIPGVGESAISLSADPWSRETWAHTIRLAGQVTRTLAGLAAGSSIGLRGPFGAGWPVELISGNDLILAAGGIGLPPLRPLIYQIIAQRERFEKVALLIGARTPQTLVFPSEYLHWRHYDIEVHATVDRAGESWSGSVGATPLLLDRLEIRDPLRTLVFTCGPEVMMRYVARSAERRRIPIENVWLSTERNMQCAGGLCGHCQLGPEFICRDGPVFRFDRIAPYLDVEGL